jgi:hypothetical protein
MYIAKATTSSSHELSAGEFVYISGASPNEYNGYFRLTTPPPSQTEFDYTLGPTSPGASSPSGFFARVWGGGRQVQENNVIELFPTQSAGFPASGIIMGWPDVPPALFVAVRVAEAVARYNVIRHVDGLPEWAQLAILPPGTPPGALSRGAFIGDVGNLIVEQNVVDLNLDPATPPIQYYNCQTAQFFANQAAAGGLIQGFQGSARYNYPAPGTETGELTITAQDAEGLAI